MDHPHDRFRGLSSTEEGLTSTAGYLRNLKQSNEMVYDPVASLSSQPAKPIEQERRRAPRYKCEGSAEFRSEGSDIRTWATITDLSRTGCYVEVQATSPVDTPVNMVIDVKGVRVSVKGRVRITYPFLGMGIAFTEINPENEARLDDLLRRLAGQSAFAGVSKPEGAATVGPDLAKVHDPTAALKAVADFFQTSPALTREEFTELLIHSQNH